MKVALIDAAPGGGHHATYALDIAHGLRRAGHQAFAAGPAAWCEALAGAAEGLPIDWTAPQGASFAQRQASQRDLFTRAFEATANAGIDVAHVLYLDGAIPALLRTGAPRRIALVATLHWYPFLGWTKRGPREALKGLLTMLGLWTLARHAVSLVVHSERAQAALHRVGVKGVHAIDYPSAVAQTQLAPDERQRVRARLGVPANARLLLCFGGTRRDKGVDLAIAALAGCGPDVQLLVAGQEEDFDRPALLVLAQRFGVTDRLRLQLGRVPQDEIVPLFGAADALLLPYRPLFTGQSGPLTIAGAVGLPVIASNVPVLAETVMRYAIGRTFDAGDVHALQAALRSEWPRVEPAARQRFVTACDPRRFASRNIEIYEQLRQPGGRLDTPRKAAR